MSSWLTLVLPSWLGGQVPTVAIGQLYPYNATPSTSLLSSSTAFLAALIACSTNDIGAIGPALVGGVVVGHDPDLIDVRLHARVVVHPVATLVACGRRL